MILFKKAILSLLFIQSIFAQSLLPPTYNYSPFEYGASGENWGVSTDSSGILFVSNNKGLLVFNGEKWHLYKLPNKTIIRSVSCIGDRIYTGSYEEFGYWTKTNTNGYLYTSLTHLIRDHIFTSEEFWQIIPHGNAVVFKSFSTIYVYKDERILAVKSPYLLMKMVSHLGSLIIGTKKNGLVSFDDTLFHPFGKNKFLHGKIVADIVSMDRTLVIGTKFSGCYLLHEGGNVEKLNEGINNALKQNQISRLLPIDKKTIAFGTIRNGIYLYNVRKQSFENINRQSGLQNNTVLAMGKYNKQLWVGLDNGIDRVDTDSPVKYYIDYSGTIGTVYDLAAYQETIYIGSNTGVYHLKGNKFELVKETRGHVWSLKEIEGDLFIGHNSGSYIINENKVYKISPNSGGYQIIKAPEKLKTYLQGSYNGIKKYIKKEEKWQVSQIKNFDNPVKKLYFEDTNVLWAAHPYKGFSRLVLDKSLDKVIEKKTYENKSILSSYKIQLHNVKNQIAIRSDGNWYRYEPILDRIIPFKELYKFNQKSMLYSNNGLFWFIDDKNSKDLFYTNLKNSIITLSDPTLRRRLVPESQKIIKKNDSIFFITLIDGYGEINIRELQKKITYPQNTTPQLDFFKGNNVSCKLEENGSFTVSFKNSSPLILEVSEPSLIHPKFSYTLIGEKQINTISDDGVLRLYNLPSGRYKLDINAINKYGKKSKAKTIQFTIAPPWYRSTIILLSYPVLFVGIILLMRYVLILKVEKKHKAFLTDFYKKQKEKIVRIEKEKLSHKIIEKQKELTNASMKIARKNNLITELKHLLSLNKNKFSSLERYKTIIKKINENIADDEECTVSFNLNLKELNNSFYKELLQNYPTLTPKDLRLCTYLKMNLSTKEISSLIGITIRGVEIRRYRLRKKINIDNKTNISTFLNEF